MSMCDCDQGRLPCTCKTTEAEKVMSEVPTLAILVLGGAWDATELGENDIQPDSKLIEELQERLVTGFDDVHIELIDRADFDRVTAERDALQARLNASDLLEALIEVTASLAWIAHGECRAIHEGPIMPSSSAVEMARAAIAKATEGASHE